MIIKVQLYIFFSIFIVKKIHTFQFNDVTSEIFPVGQDTGVLAAYGHFNNDEFTDIVTLKLGGNKLQLLKGSENHPYFDPSFNCSFTKIITSVVPGDFNGDSLLDILVTLPISKKLNDIRILWGNENGTIECKGETLFTLSVQPFVVDFNGDMIPDIIGETENGERIVWISKGNKTFSEQILHPTGHKKLKNPHSSGLIDVNHDMIADIVMTGEEDLEIWLNTGKSFALNYTISYPTKLSFVWQSTFIDINMDGKLDLLLPVCYDDKCQKSSVLIWNSNDSEWNTLIDNFFNPNDKTFWGFQFPMGSDLERSAMPPTLRYGDIDMDGYTDFITVLQSSSKATDKKVVILKNIPCDCITGRSLQIIWDVPGLNFVKNAQFAAFFDLFEDGALDILVALKSSNEWKIRSFQNTDTFDSCFLKVLVSSGLCKKNCSTKPYGVNQPGPVIRYNMTKEDGLPVVSSAVQLSQSAHFPLQLPYSIFGLGPTPNFIDVLTVSIHFNATINKREWEQIIPNSQIVVIPNPPYDSSKWVKKLFVTPSRLVMLTCISLIVTCIFISLLVALLHWKERREDKRERMQDAHRFHFDAM